MVIFRFHVELQGSKNRFRFWIKAWKRSLEMEMDQVWWDFLWGWTSIRISFCIRSSVFDDFAVNTGVFKEGLTMVWAIAKPANFEELRSSSFVFLALSRLVAPSSWRIWVRTATTMILGPYFCGIDVHPQFFGVVITVTTQTNTGVYPMYNWVNCH